MLNQQTETEEGGLTWDMWAVWMSVICCFVLTVFIWGFLFWTKNYSSWFGIKTCKIFWHADTWLTPAGWNTPPACREQSRGETLELCFSFIAWKSLKLWRDISTKSAECLSWFKDSSSSRGVFGFKAAAGDWEVQVYLTLPAIPSASLAPDR